MTGVRGTTGALARFVSADLEVPPDCVHQAKRSILNGIAAAMGAVDSDVIHILLRWTRANAAAGRARVWGHGETFSASAVALINGTMIHVLDYDDTHPGTIVHPTAAVFPAALEVAEASGRNGASLLDAYARGTELALRCALSVVPSHFDRGFHGSSTAGAIGAAAAAGRLLALDELTGRHALGIAAAMSSGLREMFGSDCKPFQVGCASRNGVVAAELASAGMGSASHALEGPLGWMRAMSDVIQDDALTGLGEEWLLREIVHKAFACAALVQPTVDAVLRLRRVHELRTEQVAQVELAVSPRALTVSRDPTGQGGRYGTASVHHAAAVALIDGSGGAAQFAAARVMDPIVSALAARVTAVADRDLGEDQARAVLVLDDGRRLATFVEHCVGSAQLPMSDELIEQKFRSLAVAVLDEKAQRRVIDLVWHLDELDDVGALGEALRRTVDVAGA